MQIATSTTEKAVFNFKYCQVKALDTVFEHHRDNRVNQWAKSFLENH